MGTEAPKIFGTPISLVRCPAVNAAIFSQCSDRPGNIILFEPEGDHSPTVAQKQDQGANGIPQ